MQFIRSFIYFFLSQGLSKAHLAQRVHASEILHHFPKNGCFQSNQIDFKLFCIERGPHILPAKISEIGPVGSGEEVI